MPIIVVVFGLMYSIGFRFYGLGVCLYVGLAFSSVLLLNSQKFSFSRLSGKYFLANPSIRGFY